MISERKMCALIAMMALFLMSSLAWIVALFINFYIFISGIIATAIMLIFDRGCYKEYGKVFLGPNYVIGVVVFAMIGFAIHLTSKQLIFGAMLLPLLYVIGTKRILLANKNKRV